MLLKLISYDRILFSTFHRSLKAMQNGVNHVGLPYFAEGKIVKGFGRGSKELGIPTANFPTEVIESLPKEIDCGIYYGLASINSGPVHKAVMSIGWNPYYQNEKKSVETHIMHKFDTDLYGTTLRIIVLGHIRPERDFSSLDELIREIQNDIKIAECKLSDEQFVSYYSDQFFTKTKTHIID